MLDPVARYKISLERDELHEKRLVLNHVIACAQTHPIPYALLKTLENRFAQLDTLYQALSWVLDNIPTAPPAGE